MKRLIKGLLTAAGVVISALGAQALDVGQSVPLFTGDSTRGTIALSDLLGEQHLVLVFYFADFTPV